MICVCVSNKKYVLSNSESVQCNFFSFLITWRSSSSKSAAVHKILWKSDTFPLIYGDISIFKMAAVRQLGIVLPPYETTHEVSVAGRSCQSNFMSIWYTNQAPKMGVLRDFGLLNVITHHRDLQKGTSLRKSASFKLSTVKIRWGVCSVGELTESVTDTHTHTHTHR